MRPVGAAPGSQTIRDRGPLPAFRISALEGFRPFAATLTRQQNAHRQGFQSSRNAQEKGRTANRRRGVINARTADARRRFARASPPLNAGQLTFDSDALPAVFQVLEAILLSIALFREHGNDPIGSSYTPIDTTARSRTVSPILNCGQAYGCRSDKRIQHPPHPAVQSGHLATMDGADPVYAGVDARGKPAVPPQFQARAQTAVESGQLTRR